MKELSIEEKAKRYDKLFVKASRIYNKENDVLILHTIEDLFPELKESEDERIKEALIEYFRWNVQQILSDFDNKEVLAWLEKQGERKPQRMVSAEAKEAMYGKPAWSEKDEKILKAIHNSVDVECLSKNELDYVVMVDWFNALKDRVQPKQEWSEEDATHYNRILKELNLQKEMPINASVIKEVKSDIIWFKSLKPQNTWKPSDEQMKQLGWIAKQNKDNMIGKELISLYQDLKKLREG